MSAKVHILKTVTRLDLPAERIINALNEANLEHVVIVGYDAAGDEYFASTYADGSDVLWLLERARFKLLRIIDEYDGES